MNKRVGYWMLAAAVLAADRVTKTLAADIPPDGIPLIPGVIALRYTENTGAAFSILSGHPWLLGLVSLAVIAGAFLYLWKKKIRPLMMTGLMMMLGGAAGNMLDRFFTGYVPDMIEPLFVRFTVFNVADMFLCTGCGLVALSLLRSGGRETENGKQESGSGNQETTGR